MFDTHCHLTDLADGEVVVREALDRGFGLLCCGYDAESCRRVVELRNGEPRLPVAVGLHPWFADQPLEPVLTCFERCPMAAVGEIGLDALPGGRFPPAEQQLRTLDVQLTLAKRLDLPVTLHSRHAVEPVLVALRRVPGLRGVFHAFSGSVEQAREVVRMGFLIGVGGGATRPNAKRIRRVIRELPPESFVLETDCPAIGMEGLEKELVRPWDVTRVAATIAELKSMDSEAVELATDRNARRLFLPPTTASSADT